MTAATHDWTASWRSPEEELLDAFLALDTPEGFKAELIEGEIVVTPPPDGDHETAIGRIVKQVFRQCPADLDFAPGKGLIVPDGRYIPDGTFTVADAMLGKESWSSPDGVVMVMEVTSSRPGKDREAKRRGYAEAGIPLYLLVDRQRDEIVLYSHPRVGDYAATNAVPVGDPLPLPEPFDFELSTDRLT
ncbi:Uma2 family endonuclease [Kitasatospora paracochleata]|uniref:Uma2 family endonuclease n=1 Tax=Kitasatospora paracochleata TaxID=58354 RepID=A0ABT1IRD7_9ACTN|nr:Uma2 family endonuclease [Kitasatospora paracochleata]MCP2307700.1 Uma2 family endonuclease [Kitasatospora paracochleata]